MRLLKVMLFLLLLATNVHAQSPEVAVEWHTLRVTANYPQDLANTGDNEYLFVWVGYSDIGLYEKLMNQRNSYAETLPGTKSGMIIGRGKILVEAFDSYALTDPKVKAHIVEKYARKLTQGVTLEEQLLLGSPEPSYPTRNLKPVSVQQPGMHKHQCGACKFVWAHYPGGSHTCPNCHTGEWLHQYEGPLPALAVR